MSRFRAYGLIFESTIPLPELSQANHAGSPDVTIRLGSVPTALSDPRASGDLYQINAVDVIYTVPQIARYLISGGSQIVVEPAEGADEASVRLFLLGPAMGALLHQRGMYALCASAVETPQGAVLLLGDSGTGKSTLTARFFQLGYRVLSDDITVIQLGSSGSPVALPEYPQLKLWSYSLQRLGYTDTSSFNRVRPELAKFAFPLGDSFCDHPLPLRAIYAINVAQKIGEAEPITGLAKMLALNRCLYRQRFAIDMGRVQDYWSIASMIVEQVPMIGLRWHAEAFDIDTAVEIVRETSR